jgi:hypothetical protein
MKLKTVLVNICVLVALVVVGYKSYQACCITHACISLPTEQLLQDITPPKTVDAGSNADDTEK